MKFDVILADPAWSFSDHLKMEKTKRGASSQYNVLTDQDIINLDIKSIVADDSILILWVPSSKLQVGMDVMKAWGFTQKQTFVWVKIIKHPFDNFIKNFRKNFNLVLSVKNTFKLVFDKLEGFDFNSIVKMNMGRLFRQGHEIALVGTKGNVYGSLMNKSQKSVILHESLKHSSKPEELQDRLDKMFPKLKKVELFARRKRDGWHCVGNEIVIGEDIKDSIKRLKAL